MRIACEDGTVGIGKGGVHGWQRPTRTMVEVMTPYLLGKDPDRIEHHYQFLYRSSHFMGAVVQGARSAIDIALWDIKLSRRGWASGLSSAPQRSGSTRQWTRCSTPRSGMTALCRTGRRAAGCDKPAVIKAAGKEPGMAPTRLTDKVVVHELA